jgi:hypothetical protein
MTSRFLKRGFSSSLFSRGWRGQMQSFQQRLKKIVAEARRRRLKTLQRPQKMDIILLAEARDEGAVI